MAGLCPDLENVQYSQMPQLALGRMDGSVKRWVWNRRKEVKGMRVEGAIQVTIRACINLVVCWTQVHTIRKFKVAYLIIIITIIIHNFYSVICQQVKSHDTGRWLSFWIKMFLGQMDHEMIVLSSTLVWCEFRQQTVPDGSRRMTEGSTSKGCTTMVYLPQSPIM